MSPPLPGSADLMRRSYRARLAELNADHERNEEEIRGKYTAREKELAGTASFSYALHQLLAKGPSGLGDAVHARSELTKLPQAMAAEIAAEETAYSSLVQSLKHDFSRKALLAAEKLRPEQETIRKETEEKVAPIREEIHILRDRVRALYAEADDAMEPASREIGGYTALLKEIGYAKQSGASTHKNLGGMDFRTVL
jgi:hypothetical protein